MRGHTCWCDRPTGPSAGWYGRGARGRGKRAGRGRARRTEEPPAERFSAAPAQG
ncbi:Hypothetical protein SCLAV_0261 [Streptomyces clavuligerus]|uniref:Uncharacterized protein n=1 Tax=Streptomyces clavuligerus TaxID=1901 RepID=E2Q790_STRCL|nr:Hypothetical protein SCLAV_0261 [Streptomyces clavuligerus]